MRLRVYFVRHGESVANVHEGRGEIAPPDGDSLSQIGHEQARKLGQRLRHEGLTHIVSSPLLRARQTAEAINEVLNLPLDIHQDIYELRQSTKLSELTGRDRHPHFSSAWMADHNDDPDFARPGAESFNAIIGRVRRFQEYLLEHASEKNILAVSHANFLRMFFGYSLLGEELEPKHHAVLWNTLKAVNTGISIFEYERQPVSSGLVTGWRLATWMDHAHL